MWIVLGLFLILDLFLLGRIYPLQMIIYNFLGFFPRADLFLDVNSPFWYFSLILFFYLIFPIFFFKKMPALGVLAIFVIAYIATKLNLPITEDVLKLYKLHIVAFPLGILFALSINEEHGQIFHNLKSFLRAKFHSFRPLKSVVLSFFKILIIFIFVYTAYHSGVEEGIRIEQTISIVTMICIILIFIFKKINFPLFEIFGKYSYEIYLLHWPLLSRYDLLYKNFEPFVAIILYLGLFLGASYLLSLVVKKIDFLLNV